jgi:hypothetical protein
MLHRSTLVLLLAAGAAVSCSSSTGGSEAIPADASGGTAHDASRADAAGPAGDDSSSIADTGAGATGGDDASPDVGASGDDAGTGSSGDDAGSGPEEAGGGDDGGTPAATCPMLTTGWTPYQPTVEIQFEDGTIAAQPPAPMLQSTYCTYTNSGGIELFRMLKDPAGRIQRCEARVHNEYTTGRNQFEGDVRVTAGNATCVHQVFLFLMLDAFPQNGGEFHEHTGALLSSGVFGKWVHVNTIHDVASGHADIYLDCVQKISVPARPPTGTGWYNKYGVYAVNHQPPVDQMAQSEWTNVKFYRQ